MLFVMTRKANEQIHVLTLGRGSSCGVDLAIAQGLGLKHFTWLHHAAMYCLFVYIFSFIQNFTEFSLFSVEYTAEPSVGS